MRTVEDCPHQGEMLRLLPIMPGNLRGFGHAANYCPASCPPTICTATAWVRFTGSYGELFVTDSTPQVALRRLLEGFTPRDNEGEIWSQESIRIDVERNQLPIPGLVLFLLLGVMGMTDLGRDDKTAWQVPFSFRGHRVTMASQKFGLRLYVIPEPGSGETAEVIAEQVVTRLRKALQSSSATSSPTTRRCSSITVGSPS